MGSTSLVFAPGPVAPGEYRFSVGTAGSVTLVLQTVLPALLTASGPSTLSLEGGTHNPLAPPFDFLNRVFLPLVRRMGPRVEASLERPGFYPAGGGRFSITVEPAPSLAGFELLERGEIRRRQGTVILSRLPRGIADREVHHLAQQTGWDPSCFEVREVDSMGPATPCSWSWRATP